MEKLTLLFLAGGMSSRFGGNPKMLTKIGPNNESLFEMSILQLKDKIKVCHVHIVVNSANKDSIMEEVTNICEKYTICNNVTYNIQLLPPYREKPFGTADALESAHDYIKTPFILLNSDDLYDCKTFELISNEYESCNNYIIGFKLGSTLIDDKKANRGFININNDMNTKNDNNTNNIAFVSSLEEKLNIERKQYNDYELEKIYVSVNLLLLQPKILTDLSLMVTEFKQKCQDKCDKVSEALLPNFLNNLIKEDKLNLKLLKSSGSWNGITYQDDVKDIKLILQN